MDGNQTLAAQSGGGMIKGPLFYRQEGHAGVGRKSLILTLWGSSRQLKKIVAVAICKVKIGKKRKVDDNPEPVP